MSSSPFSFDDLDAAEPVHSSSVISMPSSSVHGESDLLLAPVANPSSVVTGGGFRI